MKQISEERFIEMGWLNVRFLIKPLHAVVQH